VRSERTKKSLRLMGRTSRPQPLQHPNVAALWRWHHQTLERVAGDLEQRSPTTAAELRLVRFDIERHLRGLT
jgi:hypothetical protein